MPTLPAPLALVVGVGGALKEEVDALQRPAPAVAATSSASAQATAASQLRLEAREGFVEPVQITCAAHSHIRRPPIDSLPRDLLPMWTARMNVAGESSAMRRSHSASPSCANPRAKSSNMRPFTAIAGLP